MTNRHFFFTGAAAILLALAGHGQVAPETISGAAPAKPATTPPAVRPAAGLPTAPTTSAYGAGGGGFGASYYTSSSREGVPPVIVRFGDMNAKTAETLEEDLSIMSHVISRSLERAASDDTVVRKMGVPMLLTGSGRSVRAMAIEGVGPLFMIKVDFPVMGPAVAEAAKDPATDDSEWNAAKREVFGAPETFGRNYSSGATFNPEQVELLQKELILALKNAANIRGLKQSDFVNIAVFGHPVSARVSVGQPVRGSARAEAEGQESAAEKAKLNELHDNYTESHPSTRGQKARVDSLLARQRAATSVTSVSSPGASRGTVLTLRASKTDIDAFAAGKIDYDRFKTLVRVTAYAGTGYGVASVNSWSSSAASMGNWIVK